MPTAHSDPKRITLALQGGGAHGAFTWGVLDRLVEEPRLEIVAISGTSAGAINAAVFADGFVQDTARGAKAALHRFWRSVADAGDTVFNPYRYVLGWPPFSMYASIWGDVLSRLWSPYDNPFYVNGLERLISTTVNFERLRRCRKPELFICATNVKTNQRKVFHTGEISVGVLLASACLPVLFRAVEVDGEYFWDGGYMGNPVLTPLLPYSQDLLIVEVNPLQRDEVPMRATDILNRLNEVTFNSSLVQEMDMINTMTKLVERGELTAPKFKPIHFHAIRADREMSALGIGSKNNVSWSFLTDLHRLGRQAAAAWLDDPEKFGNVGVCSTCDVEKEFINPTRENAERR